MIAVSAAIVGERPTGLGVYALGVVNALARVERHLVVYTSRPEAIAPGVEIRPASAGVRPERGTPGNLVRLLWVQFGLRAALTRERPALLLSLMPDGLLFPPIPQVVTVHDLIPLHYPRDSPRQRYYFRYVVPAMLRHCQAVITISEASRRDLVQFYGLRTDLIHVAYAGYDAEQFSPDGAGARGGTIRALKELRERGPVRARQFTCERAATAVQGALRAAVEGAV